MFSSAPLKALPQQNYIYTPHPHICMSSTSNAVFRNKYYFALFPIICF